MLRVHFVVADRVSLSSLSDIATVVGYLAVSRPFLNLSHPRHLHSSHNELLMVGTTAL